VRGKHQIWKKEGMIGRSMLKLSPVEMKSRRRIIVMLWSPSSLHLQGLGTVWLNLLWWSS